MGGGWNWLRFVSNGGLWYYRCLGCDPSNAVKFHNCSTVSHPIPSSNRHCHITVCLQGCELFSPHFTHTKMVYFIVSHPVLEEPWQWQAGVCTVMCWCVIYLVRPVSKWITQRLALRSKALLLVGLHFLLWRTLWFQQHCPVLRWTTSGSG
jgi:hypothetical protein